MDRMDTEAMELALVGRARCEVVSTLQRGHVVGKVEAVELGQVRERALKDRGDAGGVAVSVRALRLVGERVLIDRLHAV